MSAREHALSAAARAGVEVRELSAMSEVSSVAGLLGAVWGRPESPPMTAELLRAFAKAGNYVGGAYVGDRLVGACVGFHASPQERIVHSHIAGVLPEYAGRAVGFALKLHQRAWALENGTGVIEWTYDPLVARNAYFNIVKLGARPVEYLPNFYGAMRDGINGDDDTDRLMVHWVLESADVVAACEGRATGRPAAPLDGVRVGVPEDVEALRVADPGKAREWRLQVRDQLVPLLAAGGHIIDFDRVGGYLVAPATTGETK